MISLAIASILILLGFLMENWVITAMGVFLGMLLFTFQTKIERINPIAEEIKYKHKTSNSPPPKQHIPHPQEMSAVFSPVIEKTLEGKKVKSDALPIFRGNPKNPLSSMLSGIPFNPFKKEKK